MRISFVLLFFFSLAFFLSLSWFSLFLCIFFLFLFFFFFLYIFLKLFIFIIGMRNHYSKYEITIGSCTPVSRRKQHYFSFENIIVKAKKKDHHFTFSALFLFFPLFLSFSFFLTFFTVRKDEFLFLYYFSFFFLRVFRQS